MIKIIFKCSKLNEKGTINVAAYVLDEPLFRQGHATLAESTLELTTFKTTLVEGIIDCNRDGLLYTSIPQNGNWKVLVDGEETLACGYRIEKDVEVQLPEQALPLWQVLLREQVPLSFLWEFLVRNWPGVTFFLRSSTVPKVSW